jgi:nucleoside-diphosphate-sugar epimerase
MGGSRFAGIAIVRRLLERGHTVTVFNRGTHAVDWHGGVREIRGDRDDAAAMARLRSLSFDGVIDMSAYTTAQTRGLLDVLGDVPRLVHCSSGAVYPSQPVLPWPEYTAGSPWPVWGAYGREKVGSELLLQEERSERAATTAIRLPYVLGPGNFADREEFVLNRLLDRAEILIPGDGRAVQQFVSVSQVGYAMVAALETFAAGGWRAFNIAAPQFTSLVGFVEVCAEVSGFNPRLRFVRGSGIELPDGVFNRFEAIFPFPNFNYVLDVTASARAGIAPPPVTLPEMIGESFAFLQSNPGRRSWVRTAGERAHLENTS